MITNLSFVTSRTQAGHHVTCVCVRPSQCCVLSRLRDSHCTIISGSWDFTFTSLTPWLLIRVVVIVKFGLGSWGFVWTGGLGDQYMFLSTLKSCYSGENWKWFGFWMETRDGEPSLQDSESSFHFSEGNWDLHRSVSRPEFDQLGPTPGSCNIISDTRSQRII